MNDDQDNSIPPDNAFLAPFPTTSFDHTAYLPQLSPRRRRIAFRIKKLTRSPLLSRKDSLTSLFRWIRDPLEETNVPMTRSIGVERENGCGYGYSGCGFWLAVFLANTSE